DRATRRKPLAARYEEEGQMSLKKNAIVGFWLVKKKGAERWALKCSYRQKPHHHPRSPSCTNRPQDRPIVRHLGRVRQYRHWPLRTSLQPHAPFRPTTLPYSAPVLSSPGASYTPSRTRTGQEQMRSFRQTIERYG
ncbi:hypothetical protein H0H81_002883, partial [Sphagnurus paluster]